MEVVAVVAGEGRIRAGDRCAVSPYQYCGRCLACRNGKTNCCERLQVLGVHIDGGMREFIVVSSAQLFPSPSLSLEQLALVEMLGIGAHAVRRSNLRESDSVLVIGAGPIGLSVTAYARLAGGTVAVMETNPVRRTFCSSAFDGVRTIDGSLPSIDAVRSILDGELPDVVFDATGSRASMERAFELTAPGGRLVLVGLHKGAITFDDPEFHRRELTLLATRNSTGEDFDHVISSLESGQVDIRPWISQRKSGGDIVGDFERWAAPESGVVKTLVEF